MVLEQSTGPGKVVIVDAIAEHTHTCDKNLPYVKSPVACSAAIILTTSSNRKSYSLELSALLSWLVVWSRLLSALLSSLTERLPVGRNPHSVAARTTYKWKESQ